MRYTKMLVSQAMRLVLFMAMVLVARYVSAETWQGWNKVELKIEDRKAFLIVPRQPAPGNPWIWRTEFFGHQPQADVALLEKGFHVAYVDMQNLYGGPLAMTIMDAMYARVTGKNKLSKRTVLEGFSRGGLFALNWAARHPESVACIYNDAPVCDFTSWPGGKGRGKGSPADWERLKKVYSIGDDEAAQHKLNPIHQIELLAKAKIPLLHVCGATDDVVPIEENSLIVQKLYQAHGGSMTLISKPHCNHHPHSLEDPTRIVNFVLTHTGLADQATQALTPFGYEYFAIRDGLQRSRTKFEKEKRGRVAFLGGSITAAKGWRDLVCDDLKRRFPQTEFDFVNAGISSLGSTPGAFRFQRDVLANGPVDLLFEEAAVNDDTNGFSSVEQVRGMEGIVRQALLANPETDIVLLHFVDPGKVEEIREGIKPTVIVNHERVAEHYRIPSIDLAREVTDRMDAGEFTWERDFKNLHPAPFGHELYARSIGRLLSAAWNGENNASNTPKRSLPEPLDRASYYTGSLVSPIDVVESKQAELVHGWKLERKWKPEGKVGTRPGFVDVPALVAEEPGATMKLTFQGKGVGIFVAAGPDTGTLEYRVNQGDWQKLGLFTQWSPSLHLPWAKMLASELANGTHELELRVSQEADERSKGNAIRIIHFLVNR
jgi:sialidase-1